jgi:hypothetical protein
VKKRKINRLISFITALVLIPSIYFGYELVLKEKFIENATKYVNDISVIEGNYLLKNEINPNNKSIKLVYGGASLSETQKIKIEEKAIKFSLENVKIEFIQGFSFDQITKKNTEVNDLKAEMNRLNMMLQGKDRQLDSINNKNFLGRQILDEIKTLYPQIIKCSYSESFVFYDNKSDPDKVEIIVFMTKGQYLKTSEKQKIENWLRTRLKSDRVKVYYEI